MNERRLVVLNDPEALARHAAEWFLAQALARPGNFAVALSGGSTPHRLYELLAQPPYLRHMPWDRIHWFWGDERFVPPTDPRSNFRMAWEAMLAHAPVPLANVHQVPTEGLTPHEAAESYEDELRRYYGHEELDLAGPLFDLTLLGLGDDGHTASLFPGAKVLSERTRWAAEVEGVKDEPRITLTYPALESSRVTAFLVEGAAKREMLGRLMKGDSALPAARLRPNGDLFVFADAAAAGPS